MGQQFRIIDFRKLHPGRTAAGKLRQRPFSFSYSFNQLRSFLDNCQISGEIRIQHIIDSQLSQQGDHFPFDKITGRQPEFFAQSNANGRRSADNNNFIRIQNGFFNVFVFIFFRNTVDRTNIGALAAVNANSFATCLFKRISTVDTDVFRTDVFAHTAFDTFAFVPDDTEIVRFDRNPDI